MKQEINNEPCFPDYSDSILNLSNSILKFYGVQPFHETLPGADYLLFTKEEVLEKELFGPGKLHENITGIGDFVATAISYKTILWNKNCSQFKSHHAGLRKEEMRIPLIWYGKKTRKNLGNTIFMTVMALIVAFLVYVLVI